MQIIYLTNYTESESEVAQSCRTLCDPTDCSLPGSPVHGIFQTRVLEWVAISFSRGSSWPRDRTRVSRIVGRRFTIWATREAYSYSQLILLVKFYHSQCAINVTFSCCWPWSLGSGVIFQVSLLWSYYFSPFPYCTLWKKVTMCSTHFWYRKWFCSSFTVESLPVTWNISARKIFFLSLIYSFIK